ncbi:MAG: hypothetical protein JSS53_06920 [Proteobacteria bacterium]|nr:hypothetical protein [Pseudomonadota bacterium]
MDPKLNDSSKNIAKEDVKKHSHHHADQPVLRPEEENDPTLVPSDQTIYEALESRGLLKTGHHVALGHRISDGHLGMMRDGEKYFFMAPGYHVLSARQHFIDSVSITEPLINLRDKHDENGISLVTIVTVPQGSLGLSHKSGITRILQPGVHILQTPHHYEGTKSAIERYIKLGTYHRILVSANEVAMAFDGKNTMIIGHEQVYRVSDELGTDGKHKLVDVTSEYKRGGIFEIINNTFSFNEQTGFKSLQVLEHEIKDLEFTTTDSSYSGTVKAIVRYRIVDPYDAFVTVNDVHTDVLRQAKATLGDILRRLTVDQVSLVPPNQDHGKGSPFSQDPTDGLREQNQSYAHWVATEFTKELESVVKKWGVGDINVRIAKLEPNDKTKANLESRAKARMETATNASLVQTQTATAVAAAEREKQVQVVKAQAEAESTAKKAEGDARVASIKAQAEAESTAKKAEGEARVSSIKAKANADTAVTKAKADADVSVIEAEAAAKITLTKAEADSQAVLLKAKSEAEAIKLKAQAENEGALLRANTENQTMMFRAQFYQSMKLSPEHITVLEDSRLRVELARNLNAVGTTVVPVDYGLSGNPGLAQLASQYRFFQNITPGSGGAEKGHHPHKEDPSTSNLLTNNK